LEVDVSLLKDLEELVVGGGGSLVGVPHPRLVVIGHLQQVELLYRAVLLKSTCGAHLPVNLHLIKEEVLVDISGGFIIVYVVSSLDVCPSRVFVGGIILLFGKEHDLLVGVEVLIHLDVTANEVEIVLVVAQAGLIEGTVDRGGGGGLHEQVEVALIMVHYKIPHHHVIVHHCEEQQELILIFHVDHRVEVGVLARPIVGDILKLEMLELESRVERELTVEHPDVQGVVRGEIVVIAHDCHEHPRA